jgi:hypothetical protein
MRCRTWKKMSRIFQASCSSLADIPWNASLSRQDLSITFGLQRTCLWQHTMPRLHGNWLQELLGHCTGMYDSNRAGILRLEAHLKQYGYTSQQGLQHPENPLEASRCCWARAEYSTGNPPGRLPLLDCGFPLYLQRQILGPVMSMVSCEMRKTCLRTRQIRTALCGCSREQGYRWLLGWQQQPRTMS